MDVIRSTGGEEAEVKVPPALAFKFKTPWLAGYPFLLAVVFSALALRLHSLDYIAESLWYEDGNVFINQAYELGASALWTPAPGGYQFLYHRLIALVAKQFPLVATPYIFFCAWLLSFISIVWILRLRASLLRIDARTLLLVILAIVFQPSQGEPWFNLNNSNFFLGIALSFYVCMPVKRPESAAEIAFLLLASITGVSSVVLTVVLVIQLLVLRDFPQRKGVYIVIPSCGIIQALFVAASRRVQHTGVDLNPNDWWKTLLTFFSFGESSIAVFFAAALFWIVTGIYVQKWVANRQVRADRALWLSPLSAVAAAALMFLVGALAEGNTLPELSPMDMESRYFLIPYSLLFFVAFTCTKEGGVVQAVVGGLLGVVCVAGFVTVDRPDRAASTGLLAHENLQWVAFTKFQKIRPDLRIPINSPVPSYPPNPHVQVSTIEPEASDRARVPVVPIILPLDTRDTFGGRLTLTFDIHKYCVRNRYLALEVDVWRSRMGFAKVSWAPSGGFIAKKTLQRFYPAGRATMQFAFRRDLSDFTIKLNPALGVADSAVVRALALYPNVDDEPGATLAVTTPPGGEVRLKEARLFCLE